MRCTEDADGDHGPQDEMGYCLDCGDRVNERAEQARDLAARRLLKRVLTEVGYVKADGLVGRDSWAVTLDGYVDVSVEELAVLREIAQSDL